MDTTHGLLHCPVGELGSLVLLLFDTLGFTLLLERKEKFGDSFIPPHCFIWVHFELPIVNSEWGREKGKQACVSVVWEAAQALY